MSKYINIEQAIEIYRKSLEQNKSFVSMLQILPSVEIVRCEECKHINKSQSITNLDGTEERYRCECIGDYMLKRNFCSYGERKDNE